MKIMSAIPTSPMDAVGTHEPLVEKPLVGFIRAVLPNQEDDNLVGNNSKQEVKQGLGRVIAKIHAYRDQTKKRKLIECYQKMLALNGPEEQQLGKQLDRLV